MGAICRLKVTALLACALSAANGNVIRKRGKIRMPQITSKKHLGKPANFKTAVAADPARRERRISWPARNHPPLPPCGIGGYHFSRTHPPRYLGGYHFSYTLFRVLSTRWPSCFAFSNAFRRVLRPML